MLRNYIVSLMYKLLSHKEGDLMVDYKKKPSDANDTTKRNRLLNGTPEKGTIFTRIHLKDIFE